MAQPSDKAVGKPRLTAAAAVGTGPCAGSGTWEHTALSRPRTAGPAEHGRLRHRQGASQQFPTLVTPLTSTQIPERKRE